MKLLRVIDFTLAFFALVFASPLMILIFFIAFNENWNANFSTRSFRYGIKKFKMFKFRTMHVETAFFSHTSD